MSQQQATPELVQQWILQSNDPSTQWQAVHYLQEWEKKSGAEVLFQILMALLQDQTTVDERVQFYALSTLGRYTAQFSIPQRFHLREILLQSSSLSRSIFLRNKVAWILARLIWHDVPMNWTTLERDLTEKLPSVLFLKTLETLVEDVCGYTADNDELHQSAVASSAATKHDIRRVKDYLKDYITTTGDVTGRHAAPEHQKQGTLCLLERLFDGVVQLLQQAVTSGSATNDQRTLLLLSLATLRRFFVWIDVASLQTGGSEMPLVLQLLLHLLDIQQCDVDVQVATLKVWSEWCSSTSASVQLNEPKVSSLDEFTVYGMLLQRIHESNWIPYQGESTSDIEVVIEVAKLINAVGLQVMESLEGSSPKPSATQLQNPVLDLFFRAFAYDDIDVSTAVLPLASRLTRGPMLNQVLPQLLSIMYQQMQYPNDFKYDYTDEDDAEEFVFRGELSKLYTKLVRAAPEPCLQFICTTASQQSSSTLSQNPTPSTEAFLRLVYHYAEGIRPSPGVKTLLQGPRKSETFFALLMAIHQSDIVQHPHPEVVCLYYETAIRYFPMFLSDKTSNEEEGVSNLLPRVLQSLTGSTGLLHPTAPKVRSRCCFFLLRLVKSVSGVMRPFVQTAISGIHGLLLQQDVVSSLRTEDVLNLFETIGQLLGRTGLSDEEEYRYLTQLLQPHMQSIERLLQPNQAIAKEDLEVQLATSIAAIANMSKGITANTTIEIKQVLLETLPISLTVLKGHADSEPVRSKTMILLQRMIIIAGDRIQTIFPRFLQLLIEHSTDQDYIFVSQLLTQVCIKLAEGAVPIIDPFITPFLTKGQAVMAAMRDAVGNSTVIDGENGLSVPPQLETEQLGIQRTIFLFIQQVVSNRVTAVLVSGTNTGQLEAILKAMSDGASICRDSNAQRTCAKFYHDLCEQWLEPKPERQIPADMVVYQRGLLEFCVTQLIPGMIANCFLQPWFDPQDAMQVRVMHEFAFVIDLVHRHLQRTGAVNAFYERSIAASFTQASPNTSLPSSVLAALSATTSAKEVVAWLDDVVNQVRRTGHQNDVLC